MTKQEEKPYIIIERINKNKPNFLHLFEFETEKEREQFIAEHS